MPVLHGSLRRSLTRIDHEPAELTEKVELVANFFKRYGRDPKPEEFAILLADARMLAAAKGCE